jgi:MoaA/NifB/PqqE/SkfB family radical SAM enzyme
MVPIEQIIEDFTVIIRKAMADGGTTPAILAKPKRLLDIVKKGEARRLKNEKKYGVPVPRFCILSVTWECNLSCKGCYAKNYSSKKGGLSLADIERVVREAADLGAFIFVIAGGEPLMVEGLLPALASMKNAFFAVFTNATLLTERHLEIIAKAHNILPVVSLEGAEEITDLRRGEGVGEKILSAMRAMSAASVAFGFSVMATRKNLHTILSRQWLDDMWGRGCRFGFIIDYIPFPVDLDPDAVLTPDDLSFKKGLIEKSVVEARPVLLNLPPDEYKEGKCQSAGRGLIHINADGFVEPCPFCHFASDNVKDTPLVNALGSGFLRSLRDSFGPGRTPSGGCLLFENSAEVAAIAAKTGAFSTETVPGIPACGPQA